MKMPANAYSQACEDRDFVEWHRGCPWCAVWVLRVDVPAVQSMVESARVSVARWLLPRYARQAHITLAFRGLMAGKGGHPAVEFGDSDLQRDIALLQSLQQPAFALQLQGCGSFSTVPYLAVQSDGSLQHLQQALALHTYPDWEYVPHITLGHYAYEVPVQSVLDQLQSAVPQGVWWQTQITELWLARYRTDDIAGPLHWEGKFDLRTQSYVTQPGALLEV